MSGWTLTDTQSTEGRTFQRPLDPTESLLLLDGCHFNGAADSFHHAELRLLGASRDIHLFSDANIVRAWLSTKRRFPLAGAVVRVPSGSGGSENMCMVASGPHFVVQERNLAVLRPDEVVFGQVACAEDVTQRMVAIWDGPRPLSDELLSQLYVFRETGSKRTDVLHLVTFIAHCVTDGMANRTIMRCLLDTLARDPDSEPAQIPLEERLGMVISSTDLEPTHLRELNPARRNWRRAIATVVLQLRMRKGGGGYTLPCRHTRATRYTLARTEFVSTSLTEEQTTIVLANCRQRGLTFGSAYLVLAQVAMTRVLYRRYLSGDISEEEWEYRKRQPYASYGPVNLRPYLDKAWYERGGGGEFMSSVNIYAYELPFMTLGGRQPHGYCKEELLDGAPPLMDLFTFDRFLYRTGLVRKQAKAFFGHPLFLELKHAASLAFLHWKKQTVGAATAKFENANNDEVSGVADLSTVFAHGGSSLGDMQLIFPTEYPLPSTHPLSPFSSVPHPARAGYVTPPSPTPSVSELGTSPKIVVVNAMTRLHVSPMELYLGALTLRGRLNMYVSYDGNVYEDEVVREWLDEVRAAVLWYLGQTHRS